jgi:hypothetical protein
MAGISFRSFGSTVVINARPPFNALKILDAGTDVVA